MKILALLKKDHPMRNNRPRKQSFRSKVTYCRPMEKYPSQIDLYRAKMSIVKKTISVWKEISLGFICS